MLASKWEGPSTTSRPQRGPPLRGPPVGPTPPQWKLRTPKRRNRRVPHYLKSWPRPTARTSWRHGDVNSSTISCRWPVQVYLGEESLCQLVFFFSIHICMVLCIKFVLYCELYLKVYSFEFQLTNIRYSQLPCLKYLVMSFIKKKNSIECKTKAWFFKPSFKTLLFF